MHGKGGKYVFELWAYTVWWISQYPFPLKSRLNGALAGVLAVKEENRLRNYTWGMMFKYIAIKRQFEWNEKDFWPFSIRWHFIYCQAWAPTFHDVSVYHSLEYWSKFWRQRKCVLPQPSALMPCFSDHCRLHLRLSGFWNFSICPVMKRNLQGCIWMEACATSFRRK